MGVDMFAQGFNLNSISLC